MLSGSEFMSDLKVYRYTVIMGCSSVLYDPVVSLRRNIQHRIKFEIGSCLCNKCIMIKLILFNLFCLCLPAHDRKKIRLIMNAGQMKISAYNTGCPCNAK